MAAPTFVAEYEAAWNNTTTPKTAAATAAANDVFVVVGGSENGGTTVSTPTGGTGITWIQQETQGTGGTQAHCTIFSAVGLTAQSWTLSVARSATANFFGFNGLRFSGSDGIGAAESGNNGTSAGLPTLNLTTTAANSSIVAIVANWNGGTATPTWGAINGYTPTTGNGGIVSFFGNTANYAISAVIYPDVGAAGLKTISQSAPTGQRYVIAAVEVLGTSGSSPSITPADDLGITDSAAIVAALDRAQADPLGLTDAAQTTTAAVRSAADPVGLTDSLQVVSGGSATPADTLGIADAVALTRSVAITDTIGTIDALGTVAGAAITDDDPVGVTDNVTVALSIARAIGDQIGATDSADADLTAPGSADLADPLGVTDLLATTAQILRSAADALGLTDSLSVGLVRSASPADPVGLSDSVTVQTGAAPSPADGIGVSDSAVAVLGRVVTIADQVAALDLVVAFNPSTPIPEPPATRTHTVLAETRAVPVLAETRTLIVKPERRTI